MAGSISRLELEQWVAQRAWSDPIFRRELLGDPASALTGMAPAGVRVEIVPETPDALCLVLSDRPGHGAHQLVVRASSDPAFRQWLLAEPRAALEGELGVRLPDAVQVRVLEERGDYWPIVLPAGPLADPLGSELPALALAAAGGGRTDRPAIRADQNEDRRPGGQPTRREC